MLRLVLLYVLLFTPGTLFAAETIPLRVVTFNAEILTAPRVRAGRLNKFRFDYARNAHLERVAGVIEVLNPDLLNLVEVTSREAVDRLVEILHEKGMTEYRGWHIDSNDEFTGMDVGVISKLQLDEVDGKTIRTVYSPEEDPTWRQSFAFTGYSGNRIQSTTSLSRNSIYFVTVAGHKLGFFGLHLKSNPSDEFSNSKRTAQAALVRRAIHSEIVRRGYLPIVLGDLNDYDPDVPDRDENRSTKTQVLKSIKDYDRKSAGDELVNAATKIVRQADRYTSHWDWNENGAADGDDVYTMIDHVLLPKQLMPFVKRVFIARCVSLDTSDHFPIVVDLLLPQAKL